MAQEIYEAVAGQYLAGHTYLKTTLSFIICNEVQDDIFAQLHVFRKIGARTTETHKKPWGQAPAVMAEDDFAIERHPFT